jgi:hypothetical protein
LHRKAEESDLYSIRTWVEVDKAELQTGAQRTSTNTDPDVQELVATLGKAERGLGAVPRLISHRYPVKNVEVVPTTYRAGKLGPGLMVLVPFLLTWWISPTHLISATWLRWLLVPWAAAMVWFAAYLGNLKLEIRADGIGYRSLYQEMNFVRFCDISSVTLIRDEHPRLSLWPDFGVGNLVLTPNPTIAAQSLKIPLLLFPISAHEQLLRILRPEELDQ